MIIGSYDSEQKFRLSFFFTAFIHKARRKVLGTKFGCTLVRYRPWVVYITFSSSPVDACTQYAAFLLVNRTVFVLFLFDLFVSSTFLFFICFLLVLLSSQESCYNTFVGNYWSGLPALLRHSAQLPSSTLLTLQSCIRRSSLVIKGLMIVL